MNVKADQAARYCPFIEAGYVCKLMTQLKTEDDPLCKYRREHSEQCRYFEMFELNTRNKQKGEMKNG